ncbi:MAG: hypothetical protein LBR83_10280 [Clostridiales bacterium]|jgi:hypothetical protein|nr:hypothetical protein [Clostridiales bacterium]
MSVGGIAGGFSPQNSGVDAAARYGAMQGGAAARDIENKNVSGIQKKNAEGVTECQTCANRKYQDGSSDPGVSFKSPTKLAPGQAAGAVYAHEREHYTREEAKAEEEGREVLSNNIRLFTDVCPECGKTYVSGGETRTVTRAKQEQAPFTKDFFDATVGKHLSGQNVNEKV